VVEGNFGGRSGHGVSGGEACGNIILDEGSRTVAGNGESLSEEEAAGEELTARSIDDNCLR
jgi:hypothetical protein